jgi:tetratricopeptide (TPR) repeat protein
MCSALGVRRAVVSIGLVVAGLAAAPAARAVTPEAEAAGLRDEGNAAFEAGHYTQATELFLKAYQVFPNGWLLYNAARAQHKAGALQDAIDSYRLFISSPESDAEYRERASQYIIEIQQTLSPPQPEPDPPPISTPGTGQPQRDLRVKPSADKPVTHSGASDLEVTVSRTPPPDRKVQRVAGWTMAVLGAGLGATSLLLHLDARSTRDDIRASTGGGGVVDASVLTQRAAMAAAREADRRETWSAVSLGLGGAALITGVVLIIRGKDRGPAQAEVAPVPGGAVAGLRGSF